VDDSVLGKLKWGTNGWQFSFALPRGRTGRGTIIADAPDPTASGECLQSVRKYVAWFQRNDTALRAYITDKMFDGWWSGWYDPEIDNTTTRLGFQRKINLAGINFYWEERWVSVVYNDGGLFGGHGIELATDFAGKIKDDPMMFG
jgi:hypothetical protein